MRAGESDPIARLRARIAGRDFDPVYVIQGSDEYRKEALVRDIIGAATAEATRDFNLDLVRGGEISAEALGSMLGTPPLMAERRVIVVRDAGSLKKDSKAELEKYLGRPARDTTLVLLATGPEPLEFAGDAARKVVVGELAPAELSRWIEERVGELGGAGIATDAKRALVSAGLSSGELSTELEKLVNYTLGAVISASDVASLVGERQGAGSAALLDAIAARDAGAALAMLDEVLAQPRTNVVTILMGLTTQTLGISYVRGLADSGVPAHQLQNELFRLLKETGALTMRPWGEAVRAWSRAVPNWDRTSLESAMRALRLADQNAKDSRYSTDSQILGNLVCAMCAVADGKERSAA
ncbi:MAG: DNA polymerase III subunit delta [Gemmatimonadota bacterium]